MKHTKEEIDFILNKNIETLILKEGYRTLLGLLNPLKENAIQPPTSLVWYDTSEYNTINDLIQGVNSNSILVHVRQKDNTDFSYGIEPSAGTTLLSTESYQTFMDEFGEAPELIFMSDDFSWLNHYNISGDKEVLFIPNNNTIVQYLGDVYVKDFSGNKIRYERSVVADYERPAYKEVPAGVETGDYFTRKTQDVIARIDAADLANFVK